MTSQRSHEDTNWRAALEEYRAAKDRAAGAFRPDAKTCADLLARVAGVVRKGRSSPAGHDDATQRAAAAREIVDAPRGTWFLGADAAARQTSGGGRKGAATSDVRAGGRPGAVGRRDDGGDVRAPRARVRRSRGRGRRDCRARARGRRVAVRAARTRRAGCAAPGASWTVRLRARDAAAGRRPAWRTMRRSSPARAARGGATACRTRRRVRARRARRAPPSPRGAPCWRARRARGGRPVRASTPRAARAARAARARPWEPARPRAECSRRARASRSRRAAPRAGRPSSGGCALCGEYCGDLRDNVASMA